MEAESSQEAVVVIQGRGEGWEQGGGCGRGEEWQLQRRCGGGDRVIGSEINQLLGVGAREGYEGSVLEAAWLGDCTRDNNAEIKMR